MERFSRTALLLSEQALKDLSSKKVLIIGIGGVGSHVVEALARTGIGKISMMDHDVVDVTNINRQIHALDSTIGIPKVEVMKTRILDINAAAEVAIFKKFYNKETCSSFINAEYDFVVDAVDNVPAKIDIISSCKRQGIPVISSMGAGNKLNPLALRIADISETKVCPLARVIRRELRKQDIEKDVPVVFSPEVPIRSDETTLIGSISFMPAVAGFLIAYHVISFFLDKRNT